MIKIYPSVFNGSLTAPPSAAHAQRLLFASALPTTPTVIRNMPDCSSVDASINALSVFGCKYYWSEDRSEVNVEPFIKTSPVLEGNFNFGDSAAAARFTIPLAASYGMKSFCTAGEDLLRRRQMVALTSRMAIRGVSFSNFSMPFEMKGRLTGGEFIFRGDEDPQYISALLLTLPMLRDDSEIIIEHDFKDSSFIDLTLIELSRFGIIVEKTQRGYKVPGRQFYKSPGEVTVENDWALAAAWAAAGVFSARHGGRVEIEDLPEVSPQLYRNLTPVFSLLSQDFEEMNIDCSKFPNMATVFAAAAAVKGAELTINGVPQLKLEDTDRLKVMAEITEKLGGKCIVNEDGITVKADPAYDYTDVKIDCHKDPWIFISMCTVSGLLRHPVILTDEHCPERICRRYLDDFRALGGKADII